MKIAFYVLSGTGNTVRVCRAIEKELNEFGNKTQFFRIRESQANTTETSLDCIVVGYPVHAFNAPVPILKFLKSLPKTQNNTPIYFVQTSGEPLKANRSAFIKPQRIAKKRGYRVLGGFSYVMPYNIIFKHSDKMAARMRNIVEKRAPVDASQISALRTNKIKVDFFCRFISFALRIEHAAMPLLGRHFKTTADCIGCGVCERACSQSNIKLQDGKPTFGGNCIGCMGCAFSCPKNAVKISLLDAWRVNGGYSFDGEPALDDEVCKYCRKAYLKYFHFYENISV